VVAHNLRFDWAFLSAAVRRWGGPMLGNEKLDTLALARRLLADEVPRFKLGELARRLRLPHQPTHRALDDAWTTVDLLHVLIERASSWGVTGLDDLIALPKIAGHPQWRKLSLTNGLPRRPGVYLFHDRDERVLYVGKATDLRGRVRSYFSSDRRRKVAQLLRETARISHRVCANTLEAELVELRLIHEHQPRFNRRNRRPISPVWVKLTTNERFPRLSVVKTTASAGAYFGPFSSRAEANLVVEAVHSALPIRRCSTRIGRRGFEPTDAPCSAAQLGVAMCPCSGSCTDEEYAIVVDQVAAAFAGETSVILRPLEAKMADLAASDRFEEAATMRDRAAAVVRAVDRQRRLAMLERVDRLVIEHRGGLRIELGRNGRLRRGDLFDEEAVSIDETLCVASWLHRNAATVRVIEASGALTSDLPALRDYRPRPAAEPIRR
jgi:DNA polymerase-3 subunit epsilon